MFCGDNSASVPKPSKHPCCLYNLISDEFGSTVHKDHSNSILYEAHGQQDSLDSSRPDTNNVIRIKYTTNIE